MMFRWSFAAMSPYVPRQKCDPLFVADALFDEVPEILEAVLPQCSLLAASLYTGYSIKNSPRQTCGNSLIFDYTTPSIKKILISTDCPVAGAQSRSALP